MQLICHAHWASAMHGAWCGETSWSHMRFSNAPLSPSSWDHSHCKVRQVHRMQNVPTSGRIGQITPAVKGVPNASEHGRKSEMAHIVGPHWWNSCKSYCKSLPSFTVPAPSPCPDVPPNTSHGCGWRAKRCMLQMLFSMMVMPSFLTKGSHEATEIGTASDAELCLARITFCKKNGPPMVPR